MRDTTTYSNPADLKKSSPISTVAVAEQKYLVIGIVDNDSLAIETYLAAMQTSLCYEW